MNDMTVNRAGAQEVFIVNNPYTLTATISHRIHMRLAEWHLAIAMFIAGWVLLGEGETFALDPYVIIRSMANEDTWGWIFICVGFLRLVVLGINGALRGSPHLRALLSGISAVIWSVLFTGFLSSEVLSLMIAVTGAAIVTEFINIVRAAGSARIEDDKLGRKNGLRN